MKVQGDLLKFLLSSWVLLARSVCVQDGFNEYSTFMNDYSMSRF